MSGQEGPLWWWQENHYRLKQLEPERHGDWAGNDPAAPLSETWNICECGKLKRVLSARCETCAPAVLATVAPEPTYERDNQLLTNERPEIIWPDHEEIIARIRARTRITREAAE